MNRKVLILVLSILFTLELPGPVQDWVVQPFTQGLATVSAWLVQLFDSSATSEGIVL